MVSQIVYLDDPKAGSVWKVVQKMDHRNVYAIPKLDPTDNDVDNVADQRLEFSMENDAETLRDTNVIQEPFQIQGVRLAPGGIPPAPPTPHRLMHRGHNQRNTRGPCRQLKTAKVTRVTNSHTNIGYDERHRAVPTAELRSSLAHDIGHVVRTHFPMQWKSWKVMPNEIKTEVRGQLSVCILNFNSFSFKLYIFVLLNTNYNLEDLDDESLAYVNRLFSKRYKQWKSDLHHHFEAFDDSQVDLQEGCPKELEGREDSWAWLCAHFQPPDYNKDQVNKGNRKKKTLLHHSGGGGSKFTEIDVFGDVYVRPGNELAESLHRSHLVLQESASQLPPETPIESVDPTQDARFQILTETLDQTLGRRPGTYCRAMGNARQREPTPRSSSPANSQVTVLTSRVAELEGQMSVILQSLAWFDIPIPNFGAPTSEPIHLEHPHQ
ncbi:unnamed protein product, partial [Prunus brigantina]